MSARADSRHEAVARLHAARPRRPFVRWSVIVLLLIMGTSWAAGGFDPGGGLSERQRANAARFLGELRPWPLQQESAPDGLIARARIAAAWADEQWRDRGAAASGTTLAISVVAILLAGAGGALASLGAARNFAAPQPFLPDGRRPGRLAAAGWRLFVAAVRIALTALRSLPEYVWAFLLLSLLGPTAWPLVLALALHNAGILGKLGAEVIENVDAPAPAALRGLGAQRLPIALAALLPLSLPRFMLFFFYRWETCVREATVLGMLGIGSLGFWIVDARARNAYDEMFFFVLCGIALVFVGDVVSAVVRHVLRRA